MRATSDVNVVERVKWVRHLFVYYYTHELPEQFMHGLSLRPIRYPFTIACTHTCTHTCELKKQRKEGKKEVKKKGFRVQSTKTFIT
jgi:hypothetical protein